MDGKPDLRVARTRAAIKDALAALVTEGGVGKITVKSLTERAGINRKTFYLHFDSIEALFESVMNDLMNDFFANYETTPDTPDDLAGHARRFFLFMAQQPAWLERLICTPGYFEFGENAYREQMKRYRSAGELYVWMPSGEQRLVEHFIRSTALEFYRSWVTDGKVVDPVRAADLLAELTCRGVEHLARVSPAAGA